AKGALVAAVPGSRMAGPRRGYWKTAGADLLAAGCRPAHYLGPDGHARAAKEAPEPRHLSPAADRAEPSDHALARASRRRAGFPRPPGALEGALSGRGRARRRPGDHARGSHADSRHARRIPVRRSIARRAYRARDLP